VLFSREGKGGRALAALFAVLLLGAALCVWLLLSAAHGLQDRGLCQMAAPGNTTGKVDALRESQHVLGLLCPSSVAQLEELALRPLQENCLRREQLQLFLELRDTLDKLPEKQDERFIQAVKSFAGILRSALLAPGAYLSCKRPWALSERVALSLMAPSAVPCTHLLGGLVREQLRARSGDCASLLDAQCSVRFMRVVVGHSNTQESTMEALEACEEHL